MESKNINYEYHITCNFRKVIEHYKTLTKYLTQYTNSHTQREQKYGVLYFYNFLSEKYSLPLIEIETCLSLITIADFENYIELLKCRYNSNELKISSYNRYLRIIRGFLIYLQEVDINKNNFRKINYHIYSYFNKKSQRKPNNQVSSQLLLDSLNYQEIKGYSNHTFKKNVLFFIKFVLNYYDLSNFADLRLSMNEINIYERHLMERIQTKIIQKSTAYQYLLSLKHFIGFLNAEGYVPFSYTIPYEFRESGKRSNQYCNTQDIVHLLDTISKTSKNKLRDLSIMLILIETGCRALEIENIKNKDINLSERIITLRSKKSGQRKLKISKEVRDVIFEYTKYRDNNYPKSDSLFILITGKPISSINITNILLRFSRSAFGEKRISPKALRHTFATNALDNGNKFDDVSTSMGHKHWVSTFYYLHRSKRRLLNNTLNHNPMT